MFKFSKIIVVAQCSVDALRLQMEKQDPSKQEKLKLKMQQFQAYLNANDFEAAAELLQQMITKELITQQEHTQLKKQLLIQGIIDSGVERQGFKGNQESEKAYREKRRLELQNQKLSLEQWKARKRFGDVYRQVNPMEEWVKCRDDLTEEGFKVSILPVALFYAAIDTKEFDTAKYFLGSFKTEHLVDAKTLEKFQDIYDTALTEKIEDAMATWGKDKSYSNAYDDLYAKFEGLRLSDLQRHFGQGEYFKRNGNLFYAKLKELKN